MGRQFYTLDELERAGYGSRQTLWRLRRTGQLGYVRINRRVLIPRSEVERFTKERYVRASDKDRD